MVSLVFPRARQAERLAAKGATFLDVRPAYQFEREHVEGAVNVPMFRKVAGSSNWDNLKRVVMRFGLAMEATGAPPCPALRVVLVARKQAGGLGMAARPCVHVRRQLSRWGLLASRHAGRGHDMSHGLLSASAGALSRRRRPRRAQPGLREERRGRAEQAQEGGRLLRARRHHQGGSLTLNLTLTRWLHARAPTAVRLMRASALSVPGAAAGGGAAVGARPQVLQGRPR